MVISSFCFAKEETAPLEGALYHKSKFAVKLWGEPALRAFPPSPPLTSLQARLVLCNPGGY